MTSRLTNGIAGICKTSWSLLSMLRRIWLPINDISLVRTHCSCSYHLVRTSSVFESIVSASIALKGNCNMECPVTPPMLYAYFLVYASIIPFVFNGSCQVVYCSDTSILGKPLCQEMFILCLHHYFGKGCLGLFGKCFFLIKIYFIIDLFY